MLWVLKRTVFLRWLFEHPKHMFNISVMAKIRIIITILKFNNSLNWTYGTLHLSICLDTSIYHRPLVTCKSAYRKSTSLISRPKHVGTQKNRLIETVLLSTQNK